MCAAALILAGCPDKPDGSPLPKAGTRPQTGSSGQSAGGPGETTHGAMTTDDFGRRHEDIEFISDGFKIRGKLVLPPDGDPVPTVLLVHMLGDNKTSWTDFQLLLADQGFGSFAIDLRGHGTSERGPRGFQDFRPIDWDAARNDVANAYHAMEDIDEVDNNNIGLVGASIGANYAIQVAAMVPGNAPVVALSPGKDYKGVQPANDLGSVYDRTLIAATINDPAAIEFLNWSIENYPQVEPYQAEGNEHGTNMFPNASLEEQIFDFLRRHLDTSGAGDDWDLGGGLFGEGDVDASGFPIDGGSDDIDPFADPPGDDDDTDASGFPID